MTGKLTVLLDIAAPGGGYPRNQGDACQGGTGDQDGQSWDLTDFRAGALLQIEDSTNRVIGSTVLANGAYTGNNCVFTFSVPLSRTSNAYQFVLGSMAPYAFTKTKALNLSVGPKY